MKLTTTALALQIQRTIPNAEVGVEEAGNNESESIYVDDWVIFMPTFEDPTYQVFHTDEIGEGDKATLKVIKDGEENELMCLLFKCVHEDCF